MSKTPDQDQRPSNLWWIGYAWNRCWHWIGRKLRRIATHWFFKLILPWVTGSYYTILDIWGDQWTWISGYKSEHEVAFCVCLVFSLVSQFLSGLLPAPKKLESDKVAREILGEFIENIGAIVQAKIDRFRQKLDEIKPNSDKFKHITRPEDQIPIIAGAAARFLRGAYGFKEDQIDITILRRKDSGGWHYHFQLQPWSHNSPGDLMERRAAAIRCIENTEAAFFPDKIKSAGEGKFVLSDRDKRRGVGSAYIYPMFFAPIASPTNCVVSIVTYGVQFCPDYDLPSCEITEAFLREICRRFEIELCLDTIKKL